MGCIHEPFIFKADFWWTKNSWVLPLNHFGNLCLQINVVILFTFEMIRDYRFINIHYICKSVLFITFFFLFPFLGFSGFNWAFYDSIVSLSKSIIILLRVSVIYLDFPIYLFNESKFTFEYYDTISCVVLRPYNRVFPISPPIPSNIAVIHFIYHLAKVTIYLVTITTLNQ